MRKSKKKIVSLLSSLALVFLVACSNNAGEKGINDPSDKVKALKGEEIVKIMADKALKDKVLIIDVRDAAEYNGGHLANAINIPVGEIEAKVSEIEDYKDKPVVVYCNTGKKSATAADTLIKKGFKNVTNGQGVKDFTSYELQTFPNVRGNAFEKLLKEKANISVLDIRPEKDLANGYIDGAIKIPLDTLKDKLADIPKDKPVYVYCNTGTKSVEGAKILKEAGYDVYNVIEGTKEYDFKELIKK